MQKIKEQITQKEHILDADKEGFLHLMNRRYLRHFSLFGKEGQDALLHSGILVIGAGGIGCSAIKELESLQSDDDDEQSGINIVKEALRAPISQIIENAGEEPSVILYNLLKNGEVNKIFENN